jgi:uncharacterized SAM-binding protein YcdF (DUF218 family)
MYALFAWLFGLVISPLNWAIALLLVSLLSKRPKRKKRMLIIAFIVIFVFSNKLLLELYSRVWNIEPVPLEKGKVYSAAIVLGGFTSEGPDGKGFFNEHADRLIEAITLKSTGKVAYIMVSGGNTYAGPGDSFTESGYVRQFLHQLSFPDSVILTEGQSTNTATNAEYTKRVLDAKHLKPPYILITSAFHMRRAMYIFKKNGIAVIPYSCDYMGLNDQLSWRHCFTFNAGILHDWDYYIKEFFGLLAAHIKT